MKQQGKKTLDTKKEQIQNVYNDKNYYDAIVRIKDRAIRRVINAPLRSTICRFPLYNRKADYSTSDSKHPSRFKRKNLTHGNKKKSFHWFYKNRVFYAFS